MVLTLITNLAFALVAMIEGVIALISLVFMGIARLILALVTSPYFINLKYTSGGIVEVGWPIVRDFANLGFALGLLWIGLATALKLSEYEAKKTLPRLILMIFLVNFSPVLCGLVVDAANIVMNFFLGAVGDWAPIWNWAKTIVTDAFAVQLSKFFTEPVSLEAVAKLSMITMFNILAGFFFLLYAVLFFVRYIAIWTLVILSPLAFFAYVFGSKTGGYFRQWWSQFIQWTIIGIPASFFLYLSYQILDKIGTQQMPPPPPGFWGDFIGISAVMNQVMIFAPVLILLLFGFLTSLSSGAMGANAVMNWTKGGLKNIGGKAAQWAGNTKWGKARLDQLSNFSLGKVGNMAEKFDESKFGKSPFGRFVKGTGTMLATPTNLLARRLGQMGKGYVASRVGDIDKIMERPEYKNLVKQEQWDTLAAIYNNPLTTPQTKIAIASLIAKEKGEQGFENMKKITGIENIDKQAAKLAAVYSPKHLKSMLANNPALAADPSVSQYTIKPRKWELDRDDYMAAKAFMASKGMTRNFSDILKSGSGDADYIRIADMLSDQDSTVSDLTRMKMELRDRGEAHTDRDAVAALAYRRVMLGMKDADIVDMSRKTVEDPRFLKEVALTKGTQFIAKMDEIWGQAVTQHFNQITGSLRSDILAKQRPQRLTECFNTTNGYLFDQHTVWDPDTNSVFMEGGSERRFNTKEEANQYNNYINGRGPRPSFMSGVGGTPPPSGIIIPPSSAPRKAPPSGGKFSGPPSTPPPTTPPTTPPPTSPPPSSPPITPSSIAGAGKVGDEIAGAGGPFANPPKNPNNPPRAPEPGGGGSTAQATPVQATPTSVPQGVSSTWFAKNLPSVNLQDLKGPQIGYTGGKILQHENGAGEIIEAHPVPGGIAYRTMVPPGMPGAPKKVEINVGGNWRALTNGQPIICGKKDAIRIGGIEYAVKNFRLIKKPQPKA